MLPTNNVKDYGYISPRTFDRIANIIRHTLQQNDFVWWQPSEPSILAACEDPETLLSYTENSTGREFPLQQTNQMWLEYAILSSIKEMTAISCIYCITESHRDEIHQAKRDPNRIINKRFNMFEFEMVGGFDPFLDVFTDVLLALGIKEDHIKRITYADACELLKQNRETYILTDADEIWLNDTFAPCTLLTHFPERTNPFWNMHMLPDGTAAKCDLILGGMECAGGAERSTNIQQQEYRFHSLPGYKQKLYNEFGQKRVLDELDFYFSLLTPLSIRSGCGIGLSRLAVALERYKKQTK